MNRRIFLENTAPASLAVGIYNTLLWLVLTLAGASAAINAAASTTESPLRVKAVLRDAGALAGAHDVEVLDGLAFVAGKRGALAIVDVRQPAASALLWFTRDTVLFEDAQTVLPLGSNRLLVGTRDVHLFDITDPRKPNLLHTLAQRKTVDRLNGFARLGDTVFAANKLGYIVAIDLSLRDTLPPARARATREIDDIKSPHDVAILGSLLVVVDGRDFGRGGAPGRMGIYRVVGGDGRCLPPEQWTLLGTLTDERIAGANRVMTRGHFAYIGSSLAPETSKDRLFNNVAAIDLSDPAKPRLRGHVRFPDERGPNGLEVVGSVAFAAGGQTVQAIDLSSPEAPRAIAHVTDPAAFPGAADDAHDLVYNEGHLFVTAQTSHGLVVLEVAEPVRRLARPSSPVAR